MPDFVTLSCPSCGAKLQIKNSLQGFACSFCGNEHVVVREGGVVSLMPVVEQLKSVQIGVDKAASELALARLREDLNTIEDARERIKNIQKEYLRYKFEGTLKEKFIPLMSEFIEKNDHKTRETFLGMWKQKFSLKECSDRWASLSIDELKTLIKMIKAARDDPNQYYDYNDSLWELALEDWERLVSYREKVLAAPQVQMEYEKHLKIVSG